MLGQDNLGEFGRGRKRKSKSRKRRKKTAHQARFARAAKQCKGTTGKGAFQSCMRAEMTPSSRLNSRRRRRKHRR